MGTVQSPVSDDGQGVGENEPSISDQDQQEIEKGTNDIDKSAQQPTQVQDDLEEKSVRQQENTKKEGDESKDSIKSSENWFTAEEEDHKHSLDKSDASLDKRSSYTDSEADSEPLAAVGLSRPGDENSDESSTENRERRLERKSTSDSSDFSLGPRATNPQEIKDIKPVSEDKPTLPPISSEESKDTSPDVFARKQSIEKESDNAIKLDPHNAPSEERRQEYLAKFQRQSTDATESEGLVSVPSKSGEATEPFRRQSTKSSSSEESESETSNKKIRRVSSSDDDSSSEEAATNQGVETEDKSSSTDTEVPQPPEELELKQLKRLETMKESPA